MVDSSDQSQKRFITEGDIASLLQRYDAMTILRLLQEVAYSAGPKIDWNALVKKTSTGITNAREYQMLWRHLAYRDSLLPVEEDAQLLDDDSDLDSEVEASPHVSNEASVEAIAHVKVMASSYMPNESHIQDNSTVEAPLTINIPDGLPYKNPLEPSEMHWSSRGINITFPVSLQKAPTEGLNGNGSASNNLAFRKKRKKWSTAEDEDLIAAVKRCGEGNWAHILKGEFKGERTASQLSQRWALIRKRGDTSNSATTQSGLQRTEAQMAANRALSLAVGNRAPAKKLTVGVPPIASAGSTAEVAAAGASSSQSQNQSQSNVVQALPRTAAATAAAAASIPVVKPRVAVKKSTVSTSRTDLVVTANSVAAAACMAGQSTPVLVPKAEPGKSAAEPVTPKVEPVKTTSAPYLPRPSVGLSVPKTEPGKNVVAAPRVQVVPPSSTRSVANGNPKNLVMAPSTSTKSPFIASRMEGPVVRITQNASASKMVATQRVSAASVPLKPLCKPEQKEQSKGNGASPLVVRPQNKTTQTNSETNAEKQAAARGNALQTRVVDKESSSIKGGVSKSSSNLKGREEVNNKDVGPSKVSNACSKGVMEVATSVTGTSNGV